jgi:agmatinase
MFKPVNSLESPRFTGVRTFMRLPNSQNLNDADIAIVGVPFDSGVSFIPGARFGPAALRDASIILKPYCPMTQINIFDHISVLDFGDINTVPGYMEESFANIEAGVADICKSGTMPVVMGGDHSVSLPILRGLVKEKEPVALVHFDSHSDTLPDYFGKPYNHGTPFYWALEEGLILPEKSTQIGIRGPLYDKDAMDYPKEKGMEIITGPDLHELGVEVVVEKVRQRIAGAPVYVTFDIDFLDAAFAPGTGTPEVGGFSSYEALKLLIAICADQQLLGMDLVEVLPAADHGGVTALAGVSLIHAFLAAVARNKSGQLF